MNGSQRWLCRAISLAVFFESAVLADVTTHFEMYGAHSTADVQRFHSLGFTQVVLENHQLATAADALGMKVMLANWWWSQTPWEQIASTVNFASTLPNVTSINLMDEPIFNGAERFPPEFYLDLRSRIKAIAPTTALSLSEYGPSLNWPREKRELFKRYLPAVDILRIDPYPVAAGQPLRRVYDWIQLARELMVESQHLVPLTVTLQTWNSGENGTLVLPTIQQLRIMAYLALLLEVDTLSFFDYNAAVWQQVPGFYEDFATLINELKEFSEAHAGWKVSGAMNGQGVWNGTISKGNQMETMTVDSESLIVTRGHRIAR